MKVAHYLNATLLLVPQSGIEPTSPAYKTGPHPLKVSRAKLGGDGENRTLNFWLQTRCVPISTTTPNYFETYSHLGPLRLVYVRYKYASR